MHEEERLGWFFGCWEFAIAFIFVVLAVYSAIETRDGTVTIGWLLGAFGWWLAGVGSIQLGKLRARLDALERLADDRSAM